MNIKRTFVLTVAVLAALATVSCQSASAPRGEAPGGDESDLAGWVDSLVSSQVRSQKLSGGMTAMVFAEDTIVYSGGSGRADNLSRISGQTPMPIGSVSKIFTAVAVMQLVEDGKIELDRPVAEYLQNLRLADDAQESFSVRDLLTHRSGVPGDLFQDWMINEAGTELMRGLPAELEGQPVAAEPGRLFSYANIGYTLLGLVVEVRSGLRYEEYLRTRIFEPAGMTGSLVYPGETDLPLPSGFTNSGNISVPGIRDVPAGNLLVSAEDMGAFVAALYDGRIISPDTLREMTTVQNAGNSIDRDFEIGLGFWLIDPLNSGELIAAHVGDLTPAFRSVLITLPERNMAVFTSINDERGGSVHVETALEIVRELIVRNGGSEPEPVDRGRFLAVPEEDRERYTGTYGTLAGLVEVEQRGNAFRATVAGNTLYFAPREYGRYGVQMRILNLVPLPIAALNSMEFDMFEADGDVWMGIWMGGIYMGAFSKLNDVSYPAAYERYTGDYSIEGGGFTLDNGTEAISDIRILKKNERYVLSMSLMGQTVEAALRPDGPGRAVTDGTGRGMGDPLEFSESDGVVRVEWSGMKLVKGE